MRIFGKHSGLLPQTKKFVLQKSSMRKSYLILAHTVKWVLGKNADVLLAQANSLCYKRAACVSPMMKRKPIKRGTGTSVGRERQRGDSRTRQSQIRRAQYQGKTGQLSGVGGYRRISGRATSATIRRRSNLPLD